MPVIELKTNIKVENEQKKMISQGFEKSFASVGEEEVSHNLLIHIHEDEYLNFRGNDQLPAALVVIHPGYLTPVEDYKGIIAGFFDVLKEYVPEIKANRIYMTVSCIDYWGFDNQYITK